MIKSGIVSFGCSGLLLLALTPIAMVGHEYKLVFVAIAFSVLTFWRLKACPQQRLVTLLLIALPILLAFGPMYLFLTDMPLISLPSTLFHFVGIAFGAALFWTTLRFARILLALGFILVTGIVAVYGYPMWIHKIAYSTFTGEVSRPLPDFVFKDHAGKLITAEDFKNRTVIIDFWTTSCGMCFIKFPRLEDLYTKMKAKPEFLILSVNVPLKGDTIGQALQMIRSRDYSFPVLFAEQAPINKQFEFNAYPTVFIIRNNRIVFCGDIENVESFLGQLN